jgi:hypothetical protein
LGDVHLPLEEELRLGRRADGRGNAEGEQVAAFDRPPHRRDIGRQGREERRALRIPRTQLLIGVVLAEPLRRRNPVSHAPKTHTDGHALIGMDDTHGGVVKAGGALGEACALLVQGCLHIGVEHLVRHSRVRQPRVLVRREPHGHPAPTPL